MTYNFSADKFTSPDLYKPSNGFTTKERDLLALMNQADDLASQLRDATRNKEGFYDTIHPLASTVGALAWKIEEMLERMQLSK
jgi:hypothetical protein